jgi:hypothetical protein
MQKLGDYRPRCDDAFIPIPAKVAGLQRVQQDHALTKQLLAATMQQLTTAGVYAA